jgi:hypothetical protein
MNSARPFSAGGPAPKMAWLAHAECAAQARAGQAWWHSGRWGHNGLGAAVPPREARGKGGSHAGQGEEAAELTM